MALEPIKTINLPLAQCYPEIADDENEQLLADVRRHWFGKFVILFSGILAGLLVAIGIMALPAIASGAQVALSSSMKSLLALVGFIVVLFIVVGTLIALWVYQQNRMLITDQNVIEVRQLSLFSRKVAHLNMINVEDVSVIKKGIIQTLLDFGNMTIQTAGEMENFSFPSTPEPDMYRRLVINAHEHAIDRVGRMGAARVEIANNGL